MAVLSVEEKARERKLIKTQIVEQYKAYKTKYYGELVPNISHEKHESDNGVLFEEVPWGK